MAGSGSWGGAPPNPPAVARGLVREESEPFTATCSGGCCPTTIP